MNDPTSELLEEFVRAIVDGKPEDSDWTSIDENARRERAYFDRLDELRAEIDRRIPINQPEDAE